MSGPSFGVTTLAPEHCEAAAALHAACFTAGWSASGFRSFLSQSDVYGFAAIDLDGVLLGLVLARSAAGEAELLTLATLPEARRRGIAWKLMQAVLERTWQSDAQRLVLEVSARNETAVGLYRRCGFVEIGLRRDYYASAGKQDALVMALRRDQSEVGDFDRRGETGQRPPEA